MQRKKFILDERRKRKLEETSTDVLALFYIVCTLEMIIKLFVTRDISSVFGELIILFSITLTFLIVQRFDKNYSPTLPRKSNGEQLSPEQTGKEKRKRMLIYAKESILSATGFVIVWGVMDYFLQKQSIIWNLNYFINKLVDILLTFIIFFIINSIYKERKIKKFNKSNESLDR